MNSIEFVVLDLDNCISDDSLRIELIDWNKENSDERYAKYHSACKFDRFDGQKIAKMIHDCGASVLIFTARPESFKEDTVAWLFNHNVPFTSIFMRAAGDNRHSVEIKKDFFETALKVFRLDPKKTLAFDDREDVLGIYSKFGCKTVCKKIHDLDAYNPPKQTFCKKAENTAADILQKMADTYRTRNAVYGSNYKMIGGLMAILFPNGIERDVVVQENFHLFELILVKISRYAVSGLKHKDSIHDAAVYAAMCEASNENENDN